MTLDERIQFLVQVAESHESDLSRLHDEIRELKDATKELQGNMKELQGHMKDLQGVQARQLQAQARNEELLAQVLESINALGRVALDHRNRIVDLEGGRA